MARSRKPALTENVLLGIIELSELLEVQTTLQIPARCTAARIWADEMLRVRELRRREKMEGT